MARKKKTISTSTIEYEQFVKKLTFVHIRLLDSSSSFDPKADARVRNRKDESVDMVLGSDYKLGPVGDGFFESVGKLSLEMRGQKTKAKPIFVECTFECHFHVDSALSKQLANRFTDQDFRIVLWPYFREFVQNMTARMARPILLPLGVSQKP